MKKSTFSTEPSIEAPATKSHIVVCNCNAMLQECLGAVSCVKTTHSPTNEEQNGAKNKCGSMVRRIAEGKED